MQPITALEERSENFEINNSAGVKVSAEGAGRHYSGTGAMIPLQPGEHHGEAALAHEGPQGSRDPLAAPGGSHGRVDGCPKVESVTPGWSCDPVERGTLEQACWQDL